MSKKCLKFVKGISKESIKKNNDRDILSFLSENPIVVIFVLSFIVGLVFYFVLGGI